MRTTRKVIDSHVEAVNISLRRPLTYWADDNPESRKVNVGHIRLDKHSQGYRLEELVEGGGVTNIGPRLLKAGEFRLFLEGLLAGIRLGKNTQLEELNRRRD